MLFSLENYDSLIEILRQKDSIKIDEFLKIIDNEYDFDVNIEIAKSLGIPLIIDFSDVYLKTKCNIFDCIFCIVDIETTGFSPETDNIIEIGAIKYHNGNVIDKFESKVFAEKIPEKITEITGIKHDMVINAPKINKVLENFKVFLEDSVFMAHNVAFDFNFINKKLSQNRLPVMKNRTICTLALARKTIKAQKYGLGFLNEFLEIKHPIRHRAYADCLIALKVFENSILNLPPNIKNTEDLINFIKVASRIKI